MTIKETVDQLLKIYPKTRKDNKELVWKFWLYELHKDTVRINELRFAESSEITKEDYVKLTSPDSITRAKRK